MIRFGRAVATSRSTAACTLSAVGAHGGVIVVAISSIVIEGSQQGHPAEIKQQIRDNETA